MSVASYEKQDDQLENNGKDFYVERAKNGRSKCRKCKILIDIGFIRVAKIVMNPFGTGKMKAWYHLPCIFEIFKRQRVGTPKVEQIDNMEGYEDLAEEDVEEILKYLPEDAKLHWKTIKDQYNLALSPGINSKKNKNILKTCTKRNVSILCQENTDPQHRDNSLRQFRKICLALSNESSYLRKTNILKELFHTGSDGKTFKGDLLTWCRLLLPGVIKTIYNLQSKQLVKIFSRIFQIDLDDMLTHLEDGDVALTVSDFFQKSKAVQIALKSTLTLKEVSEYLLQLSKFTKEDDQQMLLTEVCRKCTANDLQIFVRLIKHDLRINAGPKHILNALHADAYDAFKTCRDIERVIKEICRKNTEKESASSIISIKLLTPVLPMLAEACTSLDAIIKKYPFGLYAEIKYDGERVQLHKQGSDLKYFSRSMKPVLTHKIDHFKDYIEKAFPTGDDIILDSEVLMIDTKTGDLLPFGTLGKHKKCQFQDANPCLYIFDCLYFNGKSLLHRPFEERRKFLMQNIKPVHQHIELSETKLIKDLKDLEIMLVDILDRRLEGLVLKDPKGIYEPGKRHWIKVKRDYLFEGKAADTVDLVVLGAFYGTGHKGGLMNVFLMGCYHPEDGLWRTVTKVHGFDDETLKALQTDLDMVKISQNNNRVPQWLRVSKSMIPDFVARDPKAMPVWELTCHEFTKHDVHTADGISMRFPRIARVRSDKSWKTATTLSELKHIFDESKTNMSIRLLPFLTAQSSDTQVTPTLTRISSHCKKRKHDDQSPLKSSSSEATLLEKEGNRFSIPLKRKRFPEKPLSSPLANKIIEINNSSVNSEFRRHFIGYGAIIIDKFIGGATHRIVPGSFSILTNDRNEKTMKVQLMKV